MKPFGTTSIPGYTHSTSSLVTIQTMCSVKIDEGDNHTMYLIHLFSGCSRVNHSKLRRKKRKGWRRRRRRRRWRKRRKRRKE